MRLGRLLIILAAVLIVGMIAVVFLLRTFSGGDGADEAAEADLTTIDIIIVQQPIARGSVIVEDALGFLAYPSDETIAGMYRAEDIDQVVGMRAKFDLEPPVPLTSSMVVENISELSEAGSDASLLIPPGMVSISIPISRFSSLAYGLQRGDHVNVIATLLLVDLDTEFQTRLPNETSAVIAPGPNLLITTETEEALEATLTSNELLNNLTAQVGAGGVISPQGRAELDPVLNQPLYLLPSEDVQRPRMVSQTLLQDVVVLHMGNFPIRDEQGNIVAQDVAQEPVAEGEEAPPPPEVKPPDIISLIVSPQDAVTVNYLIYMGAQLNLALRSSGDDSRVFTEAVTLNYLLDQYNIPVPTKLPYGPGPRVDVLLPPVLINDIKEPEN